MANKKTIDILTINRTALQLRLNSFKKYVTELQQKDIENTIENYNLSELQLRIDTILPLLANFNDIQSEI